MDFAIVLTGTHEQEPHTRDQVRREVATLMERLEMRGYSVREANLQFDLAVPPDVPDLEDMTVPELRRALTNLGIDPDEDIEGSGSGGNVVKADLIEALRGAQKE